ncbi:MAG: dihydroorotate dehydrogenase electron transfer subunit [Thermoplasmatales archaeon]|nr:dihydroorotate dehydrogenase electron transfer subunit [Thermoplasmatales archaeon]
MQVCKIEKIVEESPIHKTFFFCCNELKKAKPGQFVMIWIPGIDEIPMSLSYIGDFQAITVEKVGEATEKLHKMKEGDKIGVRGPYGKGFSEIGKKALFVAGGTGIAPIMPLIRKYKGEKHVIIGARNKDLLIFLDEIEDFAEIYISTDDGSIGFKGFASEVAEKLIEEENFDVVYTCGPEIMMKKIFELCRKNKIRMQASLERYMKCGVGICDSCAIDGYHVCKDGPVFDEKDLERMKDFGKFRRNEAGRKIKI